LLCDSVVDECVVDNYGCVLGLNGVALTLTNRQEGSPLIEINGGRNIKAVAFTANGEYLVGGGEGLGVWRVIDGRQIATMAAGETVSCLAVSKDGRWIAAGTDSGEVFVWDAKTFERVFSHWEDTDDISGVDFSPDSTRLLVASFNRTATVWDITTRKRVLTLHHEGWVPVIAAKYSLQGDRIATATRKSVRVWDSNDGRSLVDIPVTVLTPSQYYNTGLLWLNNYLLVISANKIKEFEASTGSAVSEWLVHDSDSDSCIALPPHGKFIAYSTNRNVTFWDTSTHSRVGKIQHSQDIRSLALSPDDRFLAIGAHGGNISISRIRVIVSTCSFGLWRI
jgi:WD40 repeat protein